MKRIKLARLVAAAHSPFTADGALNLTAVEKQAAHLLKHRVHTVFICGSTGESHSLSFEERRQLAERWMQVTCGTPLRVVVHVGSNCLGDAKALAAHADKLGVLAISALAPCYFKPRTLGVLVDWCAEIAAAAPETLFYYYDIAALTNVSFPMADFLAQAGDRIPTLNGVKFTNTDLMSYQLCVNYDGGTFDIPWGVDQCFLSALSVGAVGAIGSSYNFAAPLYQRILTAFDAGDSAAARREQFRSVQLTNALMEHGFLAASKVVMKMLGVDVGPIRLPNTNLTDEQISKLRIDLEKLGFFDSMAANQPQKTPA